MVVFYGYHIVEMLSGTAPGLWNLPPPPTSENYGFLIKAQTELFSVTDPYFRTLREAEDQQCEVRTVALPNTVCRVSKQALRALKNYAIRDVAYENDRSSNGQI